MEASPMFRKPDWWENLHSLIKSRGYWLKSAEDEGKNMKPCYWDKRNTGDGSADGGGG